MIKLESNLYNELIVNNNRCKGLSVHNDLVLLNSQEEKKNPIKKC